MKYVFFGTSDFSVAILEKLISDFFYPALVVSQPARPAGRKQLMTEPPIKHVCDMHQLNLVQPERVKEIEQMLAELKPDLTGTFSWWKELAKAQKSSINRKPRPMRLVGMSNWANNVRQSYA